MSSCDVDIIIFIIICHETIIIRVFSHVIFTAAVKTTTTDRVSEASLHRRASHGRSLPRQPRQDPHHGHDDVYRRDSAAPVGFSRHY